MLHPLQHPCSRDAVHENVLGIAIVLGFGGMLGQRGCISSLPCNEIFLKTHPITGSCIEGCWRFLEGPPAPASVGEGC